MAKQNPERFKDCAKPPIVIPKRNDYYPEMHTGTGSNAKRFMIHKAIGYVDLSEGILASCCPLTLFAWFEV